MAEKDIQRYLDGIESQHKTKPRYMACVTALLEKVDPAHAAAKDMPAAFSVYDGVGAQLDVVGEIVGVDRKFPPVNIPGMPVYLDDDSYRQVILSKIIQNQWDGTYGQFKEMAAATLAKTLNARYRDNQNMTMGVSIEGQLSPIMVELLVRGYILPKPMGVGMEINVIDGTTEDSSWAECITTGSNAQIECPYDYFPDRNTYGLSLAGAAVVAGSGFILCDMDYNRDILISEEGYSGAAACAVCGQVLAEIQPCTITQDGFSIGNGVVGVANIAHITLSTK